VLIFASVFARAAGAPADDAFSFDLLQARALALASAPCEQSAPRVPENLSRLTYDEYRLITFNLARALWAREAQPFRAEFFHPGFLQTQTARINAVEQGRARAIPFSPQLFDYHELADSIDTSAFPADMGFTGFRLLYPLNAKNQLDELIAFQGASYFRALSKNARYGLSARGLAINTAGDGGEEFPAFEEFWLEHPAAGATSMRLWALLNGPSVTGAYQFVITPGADTVVDVAAVIYRRAGVPDEKIKTLGIAPLTSMFWFGGNSQGRPDDLRPAVHDSDGLAIHTGAGEWLWRPLDNPRAMQVMSFVDNRPRGFGLLQRIRDFAAYQDIEAAYHLRPSVWVEPVGDWGRGAVRLVELPTPAETNDNIVAFWSPATLPSAGEPLRIAYRLHWFTTDAPSVAAPPKGIVVETRQGRSLTNEPDLRRFWVDFGGDALAKLSDNERVEPVVSIGGGAELAHAASVEKNPFNNTWRAAFAIKPDDSGRPVEMRCFLKNGKNEALTETWSYLWNP